MSISADRDDIIEALGGDDPNWVIAATDAVVRVARRQAVLTTDDLWPLITFPEGLAGGRAMGKIIRWALASGVLEKATSNGYLLCLDHAELDPVHTRDGNLIRHQGPLVVYRSLLHNQTAAPGQGLTTAPDRFGDERRLARQAL